MALRPLGLLWRGALLPWFVFSGCADDSPERPPNVLLVENRPPPCRLVFRDTGVELGNTSEEAPVPDPISVAYGPDGRYYTGGNTGVGVWSAEGEPLSTLGGPGEGPGEFDSRGGFLIPVSGRDSTIHIFSPDGWWHRFDTAGAFLGRIRSSALRVAPNFHAITETGHAVHGWRVGTSPHEFHVVAPDGSVVAQWGELPKLLPESEREPAPVRYRVVASTFSGTFWAAPYMGSPAGYRLEEWSYDGQLRRELVRDPEWFPEVDPEAFPEVRPPSLLVHVDGQGILVVSVSLTRATPENPGVLYLEVIDPSVPVLLASERVVYQAAEEGPPAVFFPGHRTGYAGQVDSLGLLSFQIYDYDLIPGEGVEDVPAVCR